MSKLINKAQFELLLNEIIETLIPPWKLDSIDLQEELRDAKKILKKYPEISEGCLIPPNKRYSSLKYYLGPTGDSLIKKGMQTIKLDLPPKPTYDILPDKIGPDYKNKPKSLNILEFIQQNE